MELKSQVVSLEISKRLKELGVKQESLYYWGSEKIVPSSIEDTPVLIQSIDIPHMKEIISAFTVAELWKYFPQFLPNKNIEGFDQELHMGKNDPKNGNDDYTFVSYGYKAHERDDNSATAMGKMLIYLLENGLISNT